MSAPSLTPRARHDNLIVQPLDEELVIYDTVRDTAHTLNPTAAFVWKHANGTRSVAELTVLLGKQLGHQVDADVVWYALAQLHKHQLLEGPVHVPPPMGGMTRRELIKRFALAAAIVPVIQTIRAPSPQQGASGCLPKGTCVSGGCTNCCSGTCVVGITCGCFVIESCCT